MAKWNHQNAGGVTDSKWRTDFLGMLVAKVASEDRDDVLSAQTPWAPQRAPLGRNLQVDIA